MKPQLKLQMGRFYLSADGNVWCCYKVCPEAAEHCQAWCIRLVDSTHEYFFLDGRYDEKGKREKTLKREVLLDVVIRNAKGKKDQVDRWRVEK